jgi:hypothetical protein
MKAAHSSICSEACTFWISIESEEFTARSASTNCVAVRVSNSIRLIPEGGWVGNVAAAVVADEVEIEVDRMACCSSSAPTTAVATNVVLFLELPLLMMGRVSPSSSRLFD